MKIIEKLKFKEYKPDVHIPFKTIRIKLNEYGKLKDEEKEELIGYLIFKDIIYGFNSYDNTFYIKKEND